MVLGPGCLRGQEGISGVGTGHVLTTGLGTAAWEGARGVRGLLDWEEHGSLLHSPDQLRVNPKDRLEQYECEQYECELQKCLGWYRCAVWLAQAMVVLSWTESVCVLSKCNSGVPGNPVLSRARSRELREC